MNVRRLAQCYRCRRIFAPKGSERYCPQCTAELRTRRAFGSLRGWREVAAVFGGTGVVLLLQGQALLPTLLALAVVLGWYIHRSR